MARDARFTVNVPTSTPLLPRNLFPSPTKRAASSSPAPSNSSLPRTSKRARSRTPESWLKSAGESDNDQVSALDDDAMYGPRTSSLVGSHSEASGSEYDDSRDGSADRDEGGKFSEGGADDDRESDTPSETRASETMKKATPQPKFKQKVIATTKLLKKKADEKIGAIQKFFKPLKTEEEKEAQRQRDAGLFAQQREEIIETNAHTAALKTWKKQKYGVQRSQAFRDRKVREDIKAGRRLPDGSLPVERRGRKRKVNLPLNCQKLVTDCFILY